MKEKIAVSACLLGKNTKYNGQNNDNLWVKKYLQNKEYILICPEVAGGLPVPRLPSERYQDLVINQKKQDVTSYFKKGAIKTLNELLQQNIHVLILKSNSPSCGYQTIYDGSFSKRIIKGNGVFVELALDYHFKIYTEKDIEKMMKKNQNSF